MYADTIILYYTSHFIILGKKIGGGGAKFKFAPGISNPRHAIQHHDKSRIYICTLIRLYSTILVISLFWGKKLGGGGAKFKFAPGISNPRYAIQHHDKCRIYMYADTIIL